MSIWFDFGYLNPFRGILETEASPHAQTLRTGFWEKLDRTDDVFIGNLNQFKLGWHRFKLGCSYAISATRNEESFAYLQQAFAVGKVGLLEEHVEIPRLIFHMVVVAVALIPLGIRKLSKLGWEFARNNYYNDSEGFELRVIVGFFAAIFAVASAVALLALSLTQFLVDMSVALMTRPFLFFMGKIATLFVAPIVAIVELVADYGAGALELRDAFKKLTFKKIDTEKLNDSSHVVSEDVQTDWDMDRLWGMRSKLKSYWFRRDDILPNTMIRLQEDILALYADKEAPNESMASTIGTENLPLAIISKKDLQSNPEATAALLKLNMFATTSDIEEKKWCNSKGELFFAGLAFSREFKRETAEKSQNPSQSHAFDIF